MSEIKIGRIVLGPVQTNCYFIYRDDDEKRAVVVDPADEGARLFNALKDNGIKVEAILLTHGHFDHIDGVAKLRQLSHCEIYAARAEADLLGDEYKNCSDSMSGRIVTVTPDHLLEDGEEMEIAGMKLRMLLTPGHTEGSCCYYIEEAAVLISGDTLFEGSVGRSDLPTGSSAALIRSIKEKLLVLPEDTNVYPGHGGITTIGDEKRYNPFLA